MAGKPVLVSRTEALATVKATRDAINEDMPDDSPDFRRGVRVALKGVESRIKELSTPE